MKKERNLSEQKLKRTMVLKHREQVKRTKKKGISDVSNKKQTVSSYKGKSAEDRQTSFWSQETFN